MLVVRKPYETFAHYKLGKGFATLSISVDEGDTHVGVSFCHPRDRFDKKFGRSIASGRRIKDSHEFSFDFKRNSEKLAVQVRAEFEAYVAASSIARLKGGDEGTAWHGAPPWTIHGLNKELRRRISGAV